MPDRPQAEPIRRSRRTIERRFQKVAGMQNPFNRRTSAWRTFRSTMRAILAEQGVRRLSDLQLRLRLVVYRYVMVTLWLQEDDANRTARSGHALTDATTDRTIAYTNLQARLSRQLAEARPAASDPLTRLLAGEATSRHAEPAPNGRGQASRGGAQQRRERTSAKGGGS